MNPSKDRVGPLVLTSIALQIDGEKVELRPNKAFRYRGYRINVVDFDTGAACIEWSKHYARCGYLVPQTEDSCIAIDNRTGEAWTEDFASYELALQWLIGEVEIEELDMNERGEYFRVSPSVRVICNE
jgi:hypothetical protein